MKNFKRFVAFTVLLVGFGIVEFNGSGRFVGQIPILPPKIVLTADGGAPPAPPIPLPKSETILIADGGAPPAPPIPLSA